MQVHHDNPKATGLYVAYVNDLENPKVKFAKRIFLMWDKGWFYPSSDQRHRGTVYQSVGPLPPLELED